MLNPVSLKTEIKSYFFLRIISTPTHLKQSKTLLEFDLLKQGLGKEKRGISLIYLRHCFVVRIADWIPPQKIAGMTGLLRLLMG